MPGVPKELKQATRQIDDRQVAQVEAIIRSMTPAERGRARRSSTAPAGPRIARGSGTTTQDVNQLLRQFKEMQKMLKGGGPMGHARHGRAGRRRWRSRWPRPWPSGWVDGGPGLAGLEGLAAGAGGAAAGGDLAELLGDGATAGAGLGGGALPGRDAGRATGLEGGQGAGDAQRGEREPGTLRGPDQTGGRAPARPRAGSFDRRAGGGPR